MMRRCGGFVNPPRATGARCSVRLRHVGRLTNPSHAQGRGICQSPASNQTSRITHNTPKGLDNLAQGQRSATLGNNSNNFFPERDT
ncbi:hypothetical protein QUF80_00230 [Desulfococcaceae bacterium HSG8]|nr:hypothetical protein [Desulfococcaceae bacterium HSG8]